MSDMEFCDKCKNRRMRNMEFKVLCVRKFLEENGFVFSCRSDDYGEISYKKVKGIGEVWVKKITKIYNQFNLFPFLFLSGFAEGGIVGEDLKSEYYCLGLWWGQIEKFCKGKPKWVYLVVKVE